MANGGPFGGEECLGLRGSDRASRQSVRS
jgi:hypothetical protein